MSTAPCLLGSRQRLHSPKRNQSDGLKLKMSCSGVTWLIESSGPQGSHMQLVAIKVYPELHCYIDGIDIATMEVRYTAKIYSSCARFSAKRKRVLPSAFHSLSRDY